MLQNTCISIWELIIRSLEYLFSLVFIMLCFLIIAFKIIFSFLFKCVISLLSEAYSFLTDFPSNKNFTSHSADILSLNQSRTKLDLVIFSSNMISFCLSNKPFLYPGGLNSLFRLQLCTAFIFIPFIFVRLCLLYFSSCG